MSHRGRDKEHDSSGAAVDEGAGMELSQPSSGVTLAGPRRWHAAHGLRAALCGAAVGAALAAVACGSHPASVSPLRSGASVSARANVSARRRLGSATPAATPAPKASAFAAGSCRRFPPTHGNQHRTIFLDPGHGGPDPGTSGRTQQGALIEEKTATLAVASDLQTLLRAQGYTVVLSRTQDSSVVRLAAGDLVRGIYTNAGDHRDVVARVECANVMNADLMLSIHFNAYSDPIVGGVETFYDAARPFAGQNLRLAQLVQQDTIAGLAAAGWQIPDRGIATDASDNAPTHTARAAAYPYLLELGPAQAGWLADPSRMPGVICEPLFLTDPIEASIAAASAGQEALAHGFAQAIQAYFASSPAPASPTP